MRDHLVFLAEIRGLSRSESCEATTGGNVTSADHANPAPRIAVERSELRDRLAAAASMHPFFHPRAVAVVGASRNEESLGFRTLHGLVLNKFHGPVYAVNPKADSVGAIPCYRGDGHM